MQKPDRGVDKIVQYSKFENLHLVHKSGESRCTIDRCKENEFLLANCNSYLNEHIQQSRLGTVSFSITQLTKRWAILLFEEIYQL